MKCGFCKKKLPKEAKICVHCNAKIDWFLDRDWQILSAIGALGVVLYEYFARGNHDFIQLLFFGLLIYSLAHYLLIVKAKATRDGETVDCDS